MKTEDHRPTPMPVTVPKPRPIYDEIEVAQGPPPMDSPLSSPETPAKLGEGENSMDEDDPPRVNEDGSTFLPMADVKLDDGPSDDGCRMQLDSQ